MLKGNLSTRPFYNDRLVGMTIAVVAVAALALSAFNVTEVLSLSKKRAEFNTTIAKDIAETKRLEGTTAELNSTVDVTNMKLLSLGVHEANDLIDQRTFSWTAFLSVIEKTLPYGVRVIEVAPKPEKSVMHVDIIVVAKTAEDTFAFLDALEKSGSFQDVNGADRSQNDDGTETVLVQAIYETKAAEAKPAPAPAAKKAGKGRS